MGPVAAPGATPLARLLGMGLRLLVDDLHAALAAQGWTDVRESYGYVLLAIREHETTTTDLAALLGVTKQATSQLLDAMEDSGYLTRRPSTGDRRVKAVALTGRGHELLEDVEAIYRRLEADWANQIGTSRLEQLRADLDHILRTRHNGQLPHLRPVH